jgi:hypothetical protein
MKVNRITKKLIDELNKKCLEHWKSPKYIKPDINKIDKVWIQMTSSEIEAHLYKFRKLYKLDDDSGRGC